MGKKVLLITPPYHCGVVESAGRWANLGFAYLAGELRKEGHQVEIYDAMAKNHTYTEIRKKLIEARPDMVGSTAYTATVYDATRVLRLAKTLDPGVTTLIGGVHPTLMPEETLRRGRGSIDYLIRWEGEYTVPELVRALEGRVNLTEVEGIAYREGGRLVTTPQREYIRDLDALSPAWDLLHWEDYYLCFLDNARVALVSSSRGCGNNCTFCSQQKFWQRSIRMRSPENFVAEVLTLNQRYRVKAFFLGDEYPTCDRERWEEILDRLIALNRGIYLLAETCARDIIRDRDILHKYRKAGIIHLFIGVEATRQQTLDSLKKLQTCQECREAIRLLNEQQIITECSFILGLPDETNESIQNTLRLAHYYNPDNPHFLMIAPWPYADIYQDLSPYIEEWDYRNYNLVKPVVKPKQMTREEVSRAVLTCYRTYYMQKLPQWDALANGFKKELLFKGFRAILQNSFLRGQMVSTGAMPEEVAKLLSRHQVSISTGAKDNACVPA